MDHAILWNSQAYPAITALAIQYSLDNGPSWSVLAANTGNSGSYRWSVPEAAASYVCQVRLVSLGVDSVILGLSERFQVLQGKITISAPKAGDVWNVGSVATVMWNKLGCSGANVKIEFSADSGANWQALVDMTPNNGAYQCFPPNFSSKRCLIRITDLSWSAVTGTSDVFEIKGGAAVAVPAARAKAQTRSIMVNGKRVIISAEAKVTIFDIRGVRVKADIQKKNGILPKGVFVIVIAEKAKGNVRMVMVNK